MLLCILSIAPVLPEPVNFSELGLSTPTTEVQPTWESTPIYAPCTDNYLSLVDWGVNPDWYYALLAGESARAAYQADHGLTVRRSDDVSRALYQNYYTPSPCNFVSHGTWFGSDELSVQELLFSGEVMRQQMERGYVLVGSGDYGYHWDLKYEVDAYIAKWAANRSPTDYLLEKQGSVLYVYFADGGVERTHHFVGGKIDPVTYEELNPKQRRLYDATTMGAWDIQSKLLVPTQEHLTPEQALASRQYVGFVSGKSVNDIGRRFLLYRYLPEPQFVGVALVVGTAKRADWTGIGGTSDESFQYDHFPLILRRYNGYLWGFDFPTNLYLMFGGTINPGDPIHVPTEPVLAIDPDRNSPNPARGE